MFLQLPYLYTDVKHLAMTSSDIQRALPDAAATQDLGRELAALVAAGDVVLLEGDLGAGKSTLARALIQSLAGTDIDVPSPTFNLVQTYDVSPPVWHFDLYRLNGSEEVEELGFEDSAEGVALVEWPDRLGARTPAQRLDVAFRFHDDGRMAILTARGDDWSDRIHALRA